MKSNFRSEVFKLCNSLKKNSGAKEIGALIHDLSVSVENKQTGLVKNALHGDFAYVAKHSHNQFQGYLFVDDNAETLELPASLRVEHLTEAERILIEQGHSTLKRFVNLCLEEISERSKIVAEAINPYFLFKDVSCNQLVKPLLSDDEMRHAVNAFKAGKVYKTLIDSKFEYVFRKLDKLKMSMLIGTMEKEISRCFGEDISSDLREFSIKLMGQNKYKDVTDVMLSFSMLMIALKESLGVVCQLFYEAICGVDLIILNNDNIINIESNSSNIICKLYKVLIQGMYISHIGDGIRSILLIDCDPAHGGHIHEFGMITEMTRSFTRDMGDTTKYTFATLNEEMIYIHNITKDIIKIGLPDVIVVQ